MGLKNHGSLTGRNANSRFGKSRLITHTGITRTEKETIESVLSSLYGFNIGFALEIENGTQIVRENVKKALKVSPENRGIVDLVDIILNNQSLGEKAEEYAEYKKGVEERAKNSSINFGL